MPSNKYAEYQMYMEAYQLGLIDKVEALKKTEIYDKHDVDFNNNNIVLLCTCIYIYMFTYIYIYIYMYMYIYM